MSIGLDNPALLPLAPLVALPLLLHLLARPRPRPLAYPSLMLLARAHRNNARLKRPHHWLLLILRTLWVALILAVFLQPRHYADRRPAVTEGGGRTVILVLDATASMRASEGAQSRYARASAEAVDILRQLSPRDRANVIRARAVPEAFYAEPGVNKTFLAEELRRRPATLEGGSLHEAFRLAAEQLREVEGPREIIVLSDFQPGSWRPDEINAPADTVVRLIPAATEGVDNQAVTALRSRPAVPVAGQEILIEVEVRNFSEAPVRRALTLRVGERREHQNVDLPPDGTAILSFPVEVNPEQLDATGSVPVIAELEADTFPADDTRRAVLRFRPGLHAAVYGSDATARAWLRTLDVLPDVRATQLEHLGTLPETLDALLISGWAGESLDSVRRFAERGGLLMFRPEDPNPGMREWIGQVGAPGRATRLDPPGSLRVADPWPDLLALFEDGRFGSPARGLLFRHTPVELDPETHRPILQLESGEPVWARLTHLPAVYLWTPSLSPEESTLIAQTEWVPMFGEWLFGGRIPTGPAPAIAGDSLHGARADLPAANLTLTDFEGAELPIVSQEDVVRAREPLAPGIYIWRNADTGEPLAMRAVNLPPEESDLRTEDPEALTGEGMSALARAAELRTLREGRPLWPWLLLLAFLFAATEHAATLRAVRT